MSMDILLKQKLKNSKYPKKDFDLSSLIEACGEGFDRLSLNHLPSEYTKTEWRWIARSYPLNIEGTGSTPSEAVANLYLMLNKKDETKN